jgi:archaemetzincin
VKWYMRPSFFAVLAFALVLAAGSFWGALQMLRFNTENRPKKAELMLIVPISVRGDSASLPTRRQLNDLAYDLQQTFAMGMSIGEPLEMSPDLLTRDTGQLRIDLALSELSHQARKSDCYRVIGITARDVTIPKYNFLFGLAQSAGRTCIVSTARLGGQESDISRERLAKLSVHELGHTLGIMHSTDPASVMVYSNSLAELDATGDRLTAADMQIILGFHPELSGKLVGSQSD